MFQVDRAENRLRKLEVKRFNDLQLRERDHLQEWLANMPTALGEELLIIQKEFDGFGDTRERLDLLALDKEGQLVVIENKLDDTGRDVVWQALKYAAYVSTLKREQIVEVFQAYLGSAAHAEEVICEFLGVGGLADVELNGRQRQRVMLVAANFRKEVTAAVLWLRTYSVQVDCFKTTAYSRDGDIFIDIRKIIPVPEAEEYMIRIAEKESEESAQRHVVLERHLRRYEFWQQALVTLKENGVGLFSSVGPTQSDGLGAGAGIWGCQFVLVFGKAEARADFFMSRPAKAENKWLFDQLLAHKEEIEHRFGASLEWERSDGTKRSRIGCSQAFDCWPKGNWPEVTRWMIDHMQRLEAALRAPLDRLRGELKRTGIEAG